LEHGPDGPSEAEATGDWDFVAVSFIELAEAISAN